MPIDQDLHLLQRYESFRHDLVERGQQPLNSVFMVHYLDDDGWGLGKPDDSSRVNPAVRSEALKATDNGGASKSFFSHL